MNWRTGWNIVAGTIVPRYAAQEIDSRLRVGRETYGTDFVGDPIQHLRGECYDVLLYAHAVSEERRELRAAAQSAHDYLLVSVAPLLEAVRLPKVYHDELAAVLAKLSVALAADENGGA